MKRFRVFLLAVVLVFCAACSTVQNSSVNVPHEEGRGDTGTLTDNTAPEGINEADIAQQAYDLIENAESICKNGMEIISAAWHFGIYDAPECGTDVVMERLAAQIGCETSFIEENGGYTADELVNGDGNFGGWEFCLTTAENCLAAAGAFDSVNEALDAAKNIIRELPDDYMYYQNLRDYYTKVAAYASFFENISGSYNDLIDAIAEFEKDIQSVKEPLLFDFD